MNETPIDPNDVVALNDVRRMAAADVQRRWLESRWTFPLIPVENDAVVQAVARAVCPDHHAVFDARTHVAVPVADLRYLIDDYHSEGIGCAEASRLKALLPKEATDEA